MLPAITRHWLTREINLRNLPRVSSQMVLARIEPGLSIDCPRGEPGYFILLITFSRNEKINFQHIIIVALLLRNVKIKL